jgi:uncharacterized alpha-E superfamily protein
VRLLRCALGRLTERAAVGGVPELPGLLRALASRVAGPATIGAADRGRRLERELTTLLVDAERPGSVRGLVAAVARMARTVRDRMPAGAWRLVAELDGALGGRRATQVRRPAEAIERLDVLFVRLAAL